MANKRNCGALLFSTTQLTKLSRLGSSSTEMEVEGSRRAIASCVIFVYNFLGEECFFFLLAGKRIQRRWNGRNLVAGMSHTHCVDRQGHGGTTYLYDDK